MLRCPRCWTMSAGWRLAEVVSGVIRRWMGCSTSWPGHGGARTGPHGITHVTGSLSDPHAVPVVIHGSLKCGRHRPKPYQFSCYWMSVNVLEYKWSARASLRLKSNVQDIRTAEPPSKAREFDGGR